MTCNSSQRKLTYAKLVLGGDVMEGEWSDFVNSRIEECSDVLRKEDEMYKERFKRSQELRKQIDDISMDEDARKLLDEYFAVEFDLAAVFQPALYMRGMEESVWILKKLKVI